jgi:hypothetical protein
VPNGFLPYRLEEELLEPPLRVGLNPPKVDFLSPKEDLLPPPLAVLRPLREEGLKVFMAIMVMRLSLIVLVRGRVESCAENSYFFRGIRHY